MAISVTTRPTSSGLQLAAERPGGAPVKGAVATELSSAQSVNAAAAADATHQDPTHAAAILPGALLELVLDAQSREVIYREIDERARRVSRRVPEVAARRQKAYSRSADEPAQQPGTQADTEL